VPTGGHHLHGTNRKKTKTIFYSSNFRYRPSTFPFLGHLRPCSAPRLYVAGPLLRLPPVPSGAIPPIHAFPFFSYPRPLPFLAPASRDGENVPVKNVPVKTTLRFGPHMLKSEVRDRPSERNTPIKTPLRSWSSSIRDEYYDRPSDNRLQSIPHCDHGHPSLKG